MWAKKLAPLALEMERTKNPEESESGPARARVGLISTIGLTKWLIKWLIIPINCILSPIELVSEKRRWGSTPMGGLEIAFFRNFVLAQNSPPRVRWG